jgi:nitrogen fixation protein FixH
LTLFSDSLKTDSQLTGKVHLYRPSNAAWDRTFDLNLDANGMQVFSTQELPKGAWTVKVSWDSDDMAYFYEESLYFP